LASVETEPVDSFRLDVVFVRLLAKLAPAMKRARRMEEETEDGGTNLLRNRASTFAALTE